MASFKFESPTEMVYWQELFRRRTATENPGGANHIAEFCDNAIVACRARIPEGPMIEPVPAGVLIPRGH